MGLSAKPIGKMEKLLKKVDNQQQAELKEKKKFKKKNHDLEEDL